MAPLILDGRALAQERAPRLRERARRVAEARGAAPRLFILAFEGPGRGAPWVSGKLRACADAGIHVRTLILPWDVDAGDACAAFEAGARDARPDGVFVQFPFPPRIDGEVFSASIPPETDIDVMGPRSFREFMGNRESGPPLTVAATLALLDAHRIRLSGEEGLVIGDPTPFNRMFREALARRGARTAIVAPGSSELTAHLAKSTLVLTSLARPGAVRSRDLAPGSVVVDGGYFNPGGEGDIDFADGADHLKALAPVPGGIGPMTVSALMEAVISRAEKP